MNFANWRTTLWGSITAVAFFVTTNPDLIKGLIDDEHLTKRIFGIAGLITGFVTFLNAKDKQTSGNGTVQAPLKVDQGDGTSRTLPLSLVVALLLPALSLSGCAWLQDPVTEAKLKATGQLLLTKAEEIALNTVANIAVSSSDASAKADWLDSLAGAARADITSSDISALIGIWTPDKSHWQDLGAQLTDLAKQASTLPAQQRNELIAQALNAEATKLRAQSANPTQTWYVPPPGKPRALYADIP